jgi:hypothetical protein
MNPLDREDAKCPGAVPWTVTAFQRSRRETWKAVRVWLLLLAIAAIGFWIPFWVNRDHVEAVDASRGTRYTLSLEDETMGEFTLGLVSLVLGGAATIGIVIGVRRHYRCPRCNTVPMTTWAQFGPVFGIRRDVEMNPSLCSKCGARLR